MHTVFVATDATHLWYNEVSMYNFHTGGYSTATGHFTALVWRGKASSILFIHHQYYSMHFNFFSYFFSHTLSHLSSLFLKVTILPTQALPPSGSVSLSLAVEGPTSSLTITRPATTPDNSSRMCGRRRTASLVGLTTIHSNWQKRCTGA